MKKWLKARKMTAFKVTKLKMMRERESEAGDDLQRIAKNKRIVIERKYVGPDSNN